MTRFAESPVPCLLIGLAVESVLLILYLQTRRTAFAVAMLLVVLLTAAGIIFERIYVTDREAVEATVYELASSLEANNVPAVLSLISPQAPQIRADAQRELNRYQIEQVRILSRLEIELFDQTSPPTSRVGFTSFVKVQEGQARVQFVLTFGKEGERWRLLNYSYKIR